VILAEATVAHLGKSERAFEYAKRMFHLRPDAGLGRVLTLGLFVYVVLVLEPADWSYPAPQEQPRGLPPLALIRTVTPHLLLFTVQ